jgi:hypothetical protein
MPVDEHQFHREGEAPANCAITSNSARREPRCPMTNYLAGRGLNGR